METANDTKAAWPDLAGRLDGSGGHVLPVRVYFEDTDFSGVVYHASYVRWCERGRSDFLRLLGVHHHELIDDGAPAAFVVRRMEFDFRRPARIDDVLEVRTRVSEQRTAYLWLEQEIHHDATLLCKARVQVVLVAASGAPQRLGKVLLEAFASATR
ncbi:MAG: tol-pal system-associated acyl-CoA thioesterase [Pseudomonadota bacterium]